MAEIFPKEELVATMRCRKGALLPCKLDWPIQKFCYWGGRPVDTRPPGAPIWRDLWGVGWQKESADPTMLPFPIEHPFESDAGRWEQLVPPDTGDPSLFADLVNVRHLSNRLLIGEHTFALYQRAWLLAGMQNLLTAMAEAPQRVDDLFARIVDFEIDIAHNYLSLGIEAVWIDDDYGMNSGLGFTPEMWRRYVRPPLQKLINIYHDADALVILHSCGNITQLIDDFLEIGVEVLAPLQPSCNRLDLIRKRTAGRICMCGAIDGTSLRNGDSAKATSLTDERILTLGREGGYIVGPDDPWWIPLTAQEAMLTAVEHYRDSARRERT